MNIAFYRSILIESVPKANGWMSVSAVGSLEPTRQTGTLAHAATHLGGLSPLQLFSRLPRVKRKEHRGHPTVAPNSSPTYRSSVDPEIGFLLKHTCTRLPREGMKGLHFAHLLHSKSSFLPPVPATGTQMEAVTQGWSFSLPPLISSPSLLHVPAMAGILNPFTFYHVTVWLTVGIFPPPDCIHPHWWSEGPRRPKYTGEKGKYRIINIKLNSQMGNQMLWRPYENSKGIRVSALAWLPP